METLYCEHCAKSYRVRPEDIRLVLRHGRGLEKKETEYRFTQGCFFKTLTALKREHSRR
ncbi:MULTISPECIES: hypothetical protein [Sulfurimonas]|uniref:Uncharacterized protein n=1 Tax=Sulfurimonas diazotrophicus TaxID=3131939 RepID=A0ABZ3H6K2_9BACT